MPTKPRSVRLDDNVWKELDRVAALLDTDRTGLIKKLGRHALPRIKSARQATDLIYRERRPKDDSPKIPATAS